MTRLENPSPSVRRMSILTAIVLQTYVGPSGPLNLGPQDDIRLKNELRLLLLRAVQPQESGRVVVEDVAFLFRCQVVGVLDDADGIGHEFGPEELIGAEHDAVLESSFDQTLDVAVDFFQR